MTKWTSKTTKEPKEPKHNWMYGRFHDPSLPRDERLVIDPNTGEFNYLHRHTSCYMHCIPVGNVTDRYRDNFIRGRNLYASSEKPDKYLYEKLAVYTYTDAEGSKHYYPKVVSVEYYSTYIVIKLAKYSKINSDFVDVTNLEVVTLPMQAGQTLVEGTDHVEYSVGDNPDFAILEGWKKEVLQKAAQGFLQYNPKYYILFKRKANGS